MAKKASFFSIPINLDRDQPQPLWQQLYDSLRQQVLNRQLASGVRLPPTRALAKELGVGRNTVNNAYDQLIAEGYLEARQGSGTFVNAQLPENLLRVRAGHASKKASEKKSARPQSPPKLSRYGQKIAASNLLKTIDRGEPIPFRPGTPALDAFPFDLWRKLENDRWRSISAELLAYGPTAGWPELRKALADYLGPARGVRCEPQQILITVGTQQAIMLTIRVLVNPGDTVWVEDPGYISALNIMDANGTNIAPIPVDEEGIQIDIGQKTAPKARLVYVTPSHQYPTGVLMSLRRRLELLSWARKNDAWILEDDYDSEYRFEGHPIASLQGLDDGQRVIYVGSFSKVLFPSLRLGYMIVPPDLVDVLTMARLASDHSSPLLIQAVIADFINEGHFARHLRQMRTIYEERQNALVEASETLLNGFLSIDAKPAGLHAMAWLNDGQNADQVEQQFARAGIETPSISKYSFNEPSRQGLVLGYGAFSPPSIWQTIRTMAALI